MGYHPKMMQMLDQNKYWEPKSRCCICCIDGLQMNILYLKFNQGQDATLHNEFTRYIRQSDYQRRA
jgi:hypothetical protein